jgi:hypothetical protein
MPGLGFDGTGSVDKDGVRVDSPTPNKPSVFTVSKLFIVIEDLRKIQFRVLVHNKCYNRSRDDPQRVRNNTAISSALQLPVTLDA